MEFLENALHSMFDGLQNENLKKITESKVSEKHDIKYISFQFERKMR